MPDFNINLTTKNIPIKENFYQVSHHKNEVSLNNEMKYCFMIINMALHDLKSENYLKWPPMVKEEILKAVFKLDELRAMSNFGGGYNG